MATEEKQSPRVFRVMPLTVSFEVAGGIAEPIVPRGTLLPVRRARTFTTASDDQGAVTIDVFCGESPISANNRKIYAFELNGLPRAKRGAIEIDVVCEIGSDCAIELTAAVRGSNARETKQIDTLTKYLTDDAIQRMLARAEETKNADQAQLRLVETRNQAEALLQKAEAALRQRQSARVSSQQDRDVERCAAALGLALEQRDDTEIGKRSAELQKLVENISLYGTFDDMFSSFFGHGSSQRTRAGTPASQVPVPKAENKGQKSRDVNDQVSAVRRQGLQLGRVFGGGAFRADPNLCFVLMPFSAEMRPVYEDHVKPIVAAAGLTCLRADEVFGTDSVMKDIWENISRARIIIADLTGRNPNVLYELGIAHTLGKEAVLLTQRIEDVPFDVRNLRCIQYTYTPRATKDLEQKLSSTIRSIMEVA